LRQRPGKSIQNTSASAIVTAQASLDYFGENIVGNQLTCGLNLTHLQPERTIAQRHLAEYVSGGDDWETESLRQQMRLSTLSGALRPHQDCDAWHMKLF